MQSKQSQLLVESDMREEGKQAVNRSASMGRSNLSSNIDTTAYMTDLSKRGQELLDFVQKMPADFKVVGEIQANLRELAEVLKNAQESDFDKNKAFFSNLQQIRDLLDEITQQCEKYFAANAIKKKLMASDVRHKLKGLKYSLAF